MWGDIIIPLLAAFIGGLITMLGVVCTILYENRKTRKEYLEKNRPFFVVENPATLDLSKISIKQLRVSDDSMEDVKPDQIIFHWNSLLIYNMSNNVCMVSYIKVNGIEYKSFDNVPIKVGDFCEIRGVPLSAFIRKSVDTISIGFCDRDFNPYEYRVSFEIKECKNEKEGLEKYCHKAITFSLIDCRTNLAKSKRRK
jgi:hypothetical protein